MPHYTAVIATDRFGCYSFLSNLFSFAFFRFYCSSHSSMVFSSCVVLFPSFLPVFLVGITVTIAPILEARALCAAQRLRETFASVTMEFSLHYTDCSSLLNHRVHAESSRVTVFTVAICTTVVRKYSPSTFPHYLLARTRSGFFSSTLACATLP